MRVTDRSTVVVPRSTQSAPTAATLGAAPTVAARALAPALTVAASSFDATRQMAPLSGVLLPPAMSPPTDERLAKSINDAYTSVWEGKQFPSGAERTDLMNQAKELRAQGKSALEIQYALAGKLRLAKNGLDKTDDATLNRLVGESFQYVYDDPNHLPTGDERQKFMKVAQDLAAGGSSATEIKFELRRQIRLGKDGLDKTDDPSLQKLVEDSFRYVLENQWRPPTGTESAEWLKLAQQLRTDGNSATDIRFELRRQMRTSLSNR